MKPSPQNVGFALSQLRGATRDIHDRLEKDFHAEESLKEMAQRRATVPKYAFMYVQAARAVEPWLSAAETEGLASLPRLRRLEADLTALNISPEGPLRHAPVIGSRGEAIGFLYVMEGSTFGTYLLSQSLRRGGVDMTGIGFLDPVGDAVGKTWNHFKQLLESWLSNDVKMIDQAVVGAHKGFTFAFQCLVPDKNETS